MTDITTLLTDLSSTTYPIETLEEAGCYQIGEGYSRTVWSTPCGQYVIKVNAGGPENEKGAQNWAEWETYSDASETARTHLAECVDISDCGTYLIMQRLYADGTESNLSALTVLAAEGLEFEELGTLTIAGVQVAFDYAERIAA